MATNMGNCQEHAENACKQPGHFLDPHVKKYAAMLMAAGGTGGLTSRMQNAPNKMMPARTQMSAFYPWQLARKRKRRYDRQPYPRWFGIHCFAG